MYTYITSRSLVGLNYRSFKKYCNDIIMDNVIKNKNMDKHKQEIKI